MPEIFVLPRDRRARSGGNLYNRGLIAALRALGLPISVMSIEQALQRAKRAAPARYWIDMLLLDRAAELRAAAGASSTCFMVVHYFPSLPPGAPGRSRAAWRRLEDAAFRGAAGFLVTSPFAARELASRPARGKPVIVVPPAPVVIPGPPAPRPPGCRVLMAANVTPGKGVLEFLRSLARHLPREADLSLQIAGSLDVTPAYAARCREIVGRSPALSESVRFLGPLGPAAMKRAYERSGIFISASRMETFGMALQEARAFGLYLLTLRGGHAARHVDRPSSGEVMDSVEALALRISQIATDGALRARLMHGVRPPPRLRTWPDAAREFARQLAESDRRTA